MASTTALLHRHPPEEITTNLIAETADISKGSIYQYFANKEQIIDAAVERLAAEQAPAIEGMLRAITLDRRPRRWRRRSTSSSTTRSPTAG